MCVYVYVCVCVCMYTVWNNNEEKAINLKKRKRFIWDYLERKKMILNQSERQLRGRAPDRSARGPEFDSRHRM